MQNIVLKTVCTAKVCTLCVLMAFGALCAHGQVSALPAGLRAVTNIEQELAALRGAGVDVNTHAVVQYGMRHSLHNVPKTKIAAENAQLYAADFAARSAAAVAAVQLLEGVVACRVGSDKMLYTWVALGATQKYEVALAIKKILVGNGLDFEAGALAYAVYD